MAKQQKKRPVIDFDKIPPRMGKFRIGAGDDMIKLSKYRTETENQSDVIRVERDFSPKEIEGIKKKLREAGF